jgi:hypothetical protein
MIQLSNELNDRDEQISVLKKKESHYEQTLLDRDNMFKQDAMVRMQLGKRLEQVLMDKEEALEQLELMKVRRWRNAACEPSFHCDCDCASDAAGASRADPIYLEHRSEQSLEMRPGRTRTIIIT